MWGASYAVGGPGFALVSPTSFSLACSASHTALCGFTLQFHPATLHSSLQYHTSLHPTHRRSGPGTSRGVIWHQSQWYTVGGRHAAVSPSVRGANHSLEQWTGNPGSEEEDLEGGDKEPAMIRFDEDPSHAGEEQVVPAFHP